MQQPKKNGKKQQKKKAEVKAKATAAPKAAKTATSKKAKKKDQVGAPVTLLGRADGVMKLAMVGKKKEVEGEDEEGQAQQQPAAAATKAATAAEVYVRLAAGTVVYVWDVPTNKKYPMWIEGTVSVEMAGVAAKQRMKAEGCAVWMNVEFEGCDSCTLYPAWAIMVELPTTRT